MEGTGIGLLKYEAKCNAFEVKAWPFVYFCPYSDTFWEVPPANDRNQYDRRTELLKGRFVTRAN